MNDESMMVAGQGSPGDELPGAARGRLARCGAAAAAVAVVVLVMAGLQLGGRGGAVADADSAGPDSCALVTEAEAEAVLGPDVVMQRTGATCSYLATSLQRYAALSVGTVAGPATEEERAGFRDGAEELARLMGAQARVAEGVGDEAYTVVGADVSQLTALVGSHNLVLVLLPLPGGAVLSEQERHDALRDLATDAAARL